MLSEYVRLRRRLQLVGLSDRAFMFLGYTLIWVFPGMGYREALRAYAAFEDTAPELVHAELCRCLLAAGMEIGPEEYFRNLGKELAGDADGIFAGEGG